MYDTQVASSPIYLDYNATTPVHPHVFEALAPFFSVSFGNPSSNHCFGSGPAQAMDRARGQVAALISAKPEEIVFTSGGTEANNLAIFGALDGSPRESHVIISAIEHPAIEEVCRKLVTAGKAEVTVCSVDGAGRINLQQLTDSIKATTRLISVMTVNNIVGIIQDLDAIGRIARSRGVLFHTDAVQAAGKIPIDVNRSNIDLLSMSSHKLHGPKGVGALYIRHGIEVAARLLGGGQEKFYRAGTENVPGIVGFGAACEITNSGLKSLDTYARMLRDEFLTELRRSGQPFSILSSDTDGVPTTLALSFEGIRGQAVVEMLNAYGVAASTCSACSSHTPDKAALCPPLQAMGHSESIVKGAVRFSYGSMTTIDEMRVAGRLVGDVVTRLRTVKGAMAVTA